MQSPGSSFLHERNPQFHASLEVEGVVEYLRAGGETTPGKNIPNDPAEKISAYLGFLANQEYVNDGILTGDQFSIDRQIAAHVIKEEEVPEGYFEFQRRIAREQGHGDVQITPEMRKQMVETVQAEQRAGLGKWAEYLGGDDGGYPDWFKIYTWSSITKLSTYYKDKSEFQKRSRGTTAPYPELNREALSYVYDVLNKSRIQGEQVNVGASDAQLQKLLKSGNFGKLYAHATLEVTPDSPELRNEVRGSWTKFNQTDDPQTARRLSDSLLGHGTGWCTAGESTAKTQLQGGDFYIYYTRSRDGDDTVPRIAIRMQDGFVAEVRGINAGQEVEPNMADITAERLKDLPGSEAYIRIVQDMKHLTAIEKKITSNPHAELTSDELRFLYEVDHTIKSFHYERDPRISEIRTMRGDKDKPELAHILHESILEQLSSAFAAYKTVAEQLGGRETALSPNELEKLFTAKDKEWQANGTYDYLVGQLTENGVRFSLVATPNIEASEAQIVTLVENFGKSQQRQTGVNDELYRRGRYTGRELSGNAGNALVRLSLIPNRPSHPDDYMDDNSQPRMLREHQARHPELKARVPSLLDAVTYWHVLRTQGDKLDDESAFAKTYTHHFDLEPRMVEGWAVVPSSHVTGGAPRLGKHDGRGGAVRLAVG